MKAFLNGRLVPESKAAVPLTDRGFLYGDGIFETVRVYAGKPFLLQEHLRRLNSAMLAVKIAPPLSLMEIGRAIHRMITANRLKEAVVRVTITRGSGPRGYDTTGSGKATIAITAHPFPGYSAEQNRKGVVAAVVSVRRNDARALPPDVKSTSCLNQILARMEATDLEAQEAIMLNAADDVVEASASNVFVVKNGALVTPRLDGNVLPGITRGWVMRLAREGGYPVEERRLPVAALAAADEVFLTNSVQEIMPVARIIFNHGPAPKMMRLGPYMKTSGYIGPVTIDLVVRFRESIRSLLRA